jgi:membrane associated rhomboid family serine protease
MKLLNKLNRKFGKYAIKNLMLHITILNAIVYVVTYILGRIDLLSYFILDPALVLKGQIWRIITFVFVPPGSGIFFTLIALYFYYFIGTSLERTWGSFKFNIYYLLGIILTVIASLVSQVPVTGTFLNLSLFFAFAMLYPNMEILLFFILPVKIKYLAYANAVLYLYEIIIGSNSIRIAIVGSLLNFFLFFGKDFYKQLLLRIKTIKNRNRFK